MIDEGEADAEIHVAFGVGAVDQARARPGAREIAFVDPRTATERAEYTALRSFVIDELVAAGLEEAVPEVDLNVIGLASRPDLPESIGFSVFAMGRMPQPMSVLVWEPGS